MKLVIDIAALDKTNSAVTSITDVTPVTAVQQLILGTNEPLDLTFTNSAVTPPAAPAWAGQSGYTPTVGYGGLDADGLLKFTSTSTFTPQTAGWTGTLDLTTQKLIDAIKLQVGYAVDWARFGGGFNGITGPLQARPRWAYLYLEIIVTTTATGAVVGYAILRVPILNRVLPAA